MRSCDVKTPGRIRLLPDTVFQVGPVFQDSGENNTLYDVLGQPLLLRISKGHGDDGEAREKLMVERSLAVIAAREKVHPVLRAINLLPAPIGCKGSVLMALMQKEVSLRNLLVSDQKRDGKYAAFLATPRLRYRVFQSVLEAVFHVAELGLCLLDLKPDNVVCSATTGQAYLIDFDANFAFFMPEELVDGYRRDSPDSDWEADGYQRNGPYPDWRVDGYQRNSPYPGAELTRRLQRRGRACARSRGVCTYIMLLLLYCHLEKHDQSAFAAELRGQLQIVFQRSCVPLDLLLEDLEGYAHDAYDHKSFVTTLVLVVRVFFKRGSDMDDPEILRWFLVEHPTEKQLHSPDCSGKDRNLVRVGGFVYDDDRKSFNGWPRDVAIEKVQDRDYPCLPVSARRIYSVRGGFPHLKLREKNLPLVAGEVRPA